MAEFINTIDLLGDEVVAGAIVDRSITEFNDDVLTSVGNDAFNSCSSLISVSLPNATTINSRSFRSCSSLISVSLPKVTSIDSFAFYYCSGLISVTLPAVPPTLQSYNFENINSACVFHIPAGSLSAYQSATNWSALTGQYTFTEDA